MRYRRDFPTIGERIDSAEMVCTQHLDLERIRFAVAGDNPANCKPRWRFETFDFYNKLGCAVDATMARWPEQGRMELPATWRDGCREWLYGWLYARPYGRFWRFLRLHRLVEHARVWAIQRWPVEKKIYYSAMYFPYAQEAAGLPENIREGCFTVWRMP